MSPDSSPPEAPSQGAPRRIGGPLRFLAVTAMALVVLSVLWVRVAPWTDVPALNLAQWLLRSTAYTYLSDVRVGVDKLTVLSQPVPNATLNYMAPILLEKRVGGGDTNGLPLFLALLLASRSRRFVRHALAGYAVLAVTQACYLACTMLRELLRFGPEVIRHLGITPLQDYLFKAGYVFGGVIAPVLVPVLLWAWLERDALRALAPQLQHIVSGPAPRP